MLAPPELKQVHPLYKSPVLKDGPFKLVETGKHLLTATPGRRFYALGGERVWEVPSTNADRSETDSHIL